MFAATLPAVLVTGVPSLLAGLAALLWSTHPARHGAPWPRTFRSAGRAPPGWPGGSPPPPGHPPGHQPAHQPTRQGLLRLAAAAAVAASVWAFAPGRWGSVAAVVAALVVWRRSRAWEPSSERQRRLRLEAELPWVVDLLVSALRSGLGPVEALGRVEEVCSPDVRRELQVPLARLRLGVDPVSVWGELAGHPQLGRLGVALRRATESGAPIVDALTRLADDLRAARRAAVEVRVRRIEVRAAVPLGVCLLPAFVLLAVVPLVAGSAAQLLSR